MLNPVSLPSRPQALFARTGEAMHLANGSPVYWRALAEGEFKERFRGLYRETQRKSGALVLPARRFQSRADAPLLEAGFFAAAPGALQAQVDPAKADAAHSAASAAAPMESEAAQALGYCLLREDEASCLRLLNTGLHADARGMGLYSAWILSIAQWARRHGFAELRSRHRADHNALLIPKLRAGFRITGLQVEARFGVLAELRLPFGNDAEAMLSWRMGSRPEDERIRRRRFRS